MAESHIFPIGLFRKIPTKGKAITYNTSGAKGRLLQKAIYDKEILCQECEHNIFEPLDDYAIKILRDRHGFFKEVTDQKADGAKFILFKDIEKSKLQRFFASIMWRVSVSQQLELKKISIGHAFESKIARDLNNNTVIDYLDILVFFLAHPIHSAFYLPREMMIQPRDKGRDPSEVNGWMLQFPFITVVLSLYQLRHPCRCFFSFSPELTGERTPMLSSTSVHPENNAYNFMAVEMNSSSRKLMQFVGIYNKHKRNP
jgi:hypothetical protein